MLRVVSPSDGTAVLSCDTCGAEFAAPGPADQRMTWLAARRIGWVELRVGGIVWQRCPRCARRGETAAAAGL